MFNVCRKKKEIKMIEVLPIFLNIVFKPEVEKLADCTKDTGQDSIKLKYLTDVSSADQHYKLRINRS